MLVNILLSIDNVREIEYLKRAGLAENTKGAETMKYKVQYIDGHDLKYKTFSTTAESPEDAVRKLRDSYEADFDHQIIEVYEESEV